MARGRTYIRGAAAVAQTAESTVSPPRRTHEASGVTIHSTARDGKTVENTDDATTLPLIDERWLARVQETIERLERRAQAGERFARLALVGWVAELERLEEGRIY